MANAVLLEEEQCLQNLSEQRPRFIFLKPPLICHHVKYLTPVAEWRDDV